MNNRILHTPEGIRDLYGTACVKKRERMRKIREVFDRYAYEVIETPSIEFFDVFSSDVGTTPSNELYKFFDRDGNTLVLRPDFTPSVARAVSMYFPEEAFPARLCYEGSTFVNSVEYEGRFKETTQMGVELIGDDAASADAEVIALCCDALLSSGMDQFQISVGEVDFFKSLAERSGLPQEVIEEIRTLISLKNEYGVREVLKRERYDGLIADAFAALPQLFGGTEVLKTAARYAGSAGEIAAIARLNEIHQILEEKDLGRYVSYDFGMLSKYHYYTGIIFSAYGYGVGEALAKGGRYDTLLGHFGTDRPAVGCAIYMDQLSAALDRGERKGKEAQL